MKESLMIPAFTIQDLEDFCPLGHWKLVAVEGERDVVGEFYNGNLLTIQLIDGNSEDTVILEAA